MSYFEVAASSASPEWPTPQWLVDQLAAEFGPFDTDPCSTVANHKAPLFYTIEDDGLSQPWKGVVWLNPPYGRTIGDWMAKARAEVANGNAERVVCLPPARPGSGWWLESVAAASLVRIWPGRIKFEGVTKSGKPQSARSPRRSSCSESSPDGTARHTKGALSVTASTGRHVPTRRRAALPAASECHG